MYTVKEAAQITGLTQHAVRFYTDKGLVPSIQRNQNNIRMFDDESINWLHGGNASSNPGCRLNSLKSISISVSKGIRPFRNASHL